MISRNVRLAPMTSWLVGGPAEYYAEPSTESELEQALRFAHEKHLPVTVLGGGTNVLVADEGIQGLVIVLKRFNQSKVSEVNGSLRLEASAGFSKSEMLKVFLKAKLAPALFLAGLPGDIGGGVVMNAGVGELITPREFVEITTAIEVWRWPEQGDFQLQRVFLNASELNWSYRHCEGWRPGLIAKVWVEWPLAPDSTILERVREANRLRLQKQPLDKPSCGSVFVNPPGDSAGRLIESCGLKGFTIGGAQVSEKHANFIVNLGGATADEIWQVIIHVQSTVLDQTGVKLKTEVVRLGKGSGLAAGSGLDAGLPARLNRKD